MAFLDDTPGHENASYAKKKKMLKEGEINGINIT